jgi:hypothetical protein
MVSFKVLGRSLANDGQKKGKHYCQTKNPQKRIFLDLIAQLLCYKPNYSMHYEEKVNNLGV